MARRRRMAARCDRRFAWDHRAGDRRGRLYGDLCCAGLVARARARRSFRGGARGGGRWGGGGRGWGETRRPPTMWAGGAAACGRGGGGGELGLPFVADQPLD